VFDTNIVVAFFLGAPRTIVWKIWQYWYIRRELQLVISPELREEYLEILSDRAQIPDPLFEGFKHTLDTRSIVTKVNLGTRFTSCVDPDDNVVLATAAAGNAEYLITRDHHLLDIPENEKRKFRFKIVSPDQFLIVIQARTQ
jgi:putative PIN family toxin of toxin-antitoxin system